MDWFRDQMKKGMNPRTYVLVGFLVGVLLWIQVLDQKQKALRAKNPAVTLAPAPAIPAVRHEERDPAHASMTPLGWGGDPFGRRITDVGESPGAMRTVARATPPAAGTGLYLQGIMEGPLGKTALINGDIYREGQRIGSREVIQIGRKSVMLLDHGNVTTLMLKGEGS
ncbi:MAG TPA: hypothetical protein VER38_06745 [Candidatus Eisenbacteria bacterium]|nr:hypothetical protein [Candidatus Eisenbacteria bacterium]